MKIDPHNFELYCFKVGSFLDTEYSAFVHSDISYGIEVLEKLI